MLILFLFNICFENCYYLPNAFLEKNEAKLILLKNFILWCVEK